MYAVKSVNCKPANFHCPMFTKEEWEGICDEHENLVPVTKLVK